MVKRFQNKIASSRFALPFMTVCALIVCQLWGMLNSRYIVQLLCLALSTYLMAEMNNQNALLRIPSRMVSCSFLMMAMITCSAQRGLYVAITQVLFIACLFILFSAYQDNKARGKMCCAYACIGLASIMWPQALLLVPFLWFCSTVFLLQMSWKNFMASLLGLLLPYWLYAGWKALNGNFGWIVTHFSQIGVWETLSWSSSNFVLDMIVLSFIVVLMLIGTVHFFRRSYLDKLRTRYLYDMFIFLAVVMLIFLAVLPNSHYVVIHLLIVCVSPLIAHFIALTNTRATNLTFILLLVTSIVLIILTLNPKILPS